MNIKELLKENIQKLNEQNIEEPVQKARLLLCNILKVSKEYLIVHDSLEVEDKVKKEYEKDIDSLILKKPLQYITNNQEFMKLNFYVDENVLIPRADTENLVEEVIQIANSQNKKSIFDLCTGSGAIAISCAKYVQNVEIYASDISKSALEVARKNAKQNNVTINFIESNLFEKIENKKFDIIVSNPPYIKTNIIKQLDIEVQKEPYIALDGGKDGLDFYKKIIEQAPHFLNKEGYLCLEIGYDQKKQVEEIYRRTNKYKEVYSIKDLSGNDRIVVGKIR